MLVCVIQSFWTFPGWRSDSKQSHAGCHDWDPWI